MVNQERKKKPVFQSSEAEMPVTIDPPLRAADEDLDTLLQTTETAELDQKPEEIVVENTRKASEWLENGWRELTDVQKSGKSFHLASDLDSGAIRGFWRKTRVLSHFKWIISGKWTDSLTNRELIPAPKYYKEI